MTMRALAEAAAHSQSYPAATTGNSRGYHAVVTGFAQLQQVTMRKSIRWRVVDLPVSATQSTFSVSGSLNREFYSVR